MDRVRTVDRASRAARIQGGVFGPALETQLRPHGLTLRHFPAKLRVSRPWAAGSRPAPAAISPRSTRISTISSKACAWSRRPACCETRRLPGSGAGPSPDRMFIGSEGILGVITEAWMRLQDRPRFRAGRAVRFTDFFAAARAVRVISQAGPLSVQLPHPRSAGGVQHRRRRWHVRDHGAGLRIRRPSAGRLDAAGARMLRGSWRRARGGGADARRSAAALAQGLHPHALCARAHDATRASSPTRSRPRSPGTGSRRSMTSDQGGDRGRDPRRHRQAGTGHVPLHPCLSGRPGALFHVPRARPPRRAARAVAGDQDGGERCADRGGRHHHPSPRGRARAPALVRSPAPAAVRGGAARRAKRALDPHGMLNPGVLIDP